MTDGGGGKKSNSSSSTLFQKAGQTIKSVVSAAASAAAVAKAANDQALVNSILKESRDPVAQLQRVRENRAQAQATTPTVAGHSFLRSVKKFACMTQEEYDAGSEVYGPQISSTVPQLIEDQSEDNIRSAQDYLVIAGGIGVIPKGLIGYSAGNYSTWNETWTGSESHNQRKPDKYRLN